jgi:hypothetical protein
VATSAPARQKQGREVIQPEQQAQEHADVTVTSESSTINGVTGIEQPEPGHEPQHDSVAAPQHAAAGFQQPAALQALQQPADTMGQQQQQFWQQEDYHEEQDEPAAAAGAEDAHVLLQQQQQDEHLWEQQELYASCKANQQQTYSKPAKAALPAQQRQPRIQQPQVQEQRTAETSQTVVQLQQELMQQAKLREVR